MAFSYLTEIYCPVWWVVQVEVDTEQVQNMRQGGDCLTEIWDLDEELRASVCVGCASQIKAGNRIP